MAALTYIGNGEFIIDIPARNLTEQEVLEFGKAYLLETGLYTEATPDDDIFGIPSEAIDSLGDKMTTTKKGAK